MLKGMDRWLAGYLASSFRGRKTGQGPQHILFCVVDHFEPFECTVLPSGEITGGLGADAARRNVHAWCDDYQHTTEGFRDADGMSPRHTFFYPWDEYDSGCLDILSRFCSTGAGEVELHLHHRHDTAAGLTEKLSTCRDTYAREHGLLGRDAAGAARYAFVHGNWALCNSRPDRDWCGVDQELAVLAQTGCYADFTFPSAPSPTQPETVNAIYYGRDPQGRERGHQVERSVRVGGVHAADRVLCVQGPLGLNWRMRKWGLLPRIENAELSGVNPPTETRLALWLQINIHVAGRPEWTIIKLHTHGMSARSRAGVIGPVMRNFHAVLTRQCNDTGERCLHYVTARELFNIIKAAEAGCDGNPGDYRNRGIAPPPFA